MFLSNIMKWQWTYSTDNMNISYELRHLNQEDQSDRPLLHSLYFNKHHPWLSKQPPYKYHNTHKKICHAQQINIFYCVSESMTLTWIKICCNMQTFTHNTLWWSFHRNSDTLKHNLNISSLPWYLMFTSPCSETPKQEKFLLAWFKLVEGFLP